MLRCTILGLLPGAPSPARWVRAGPRGRRQRACRRHPGREAGIARDPLGLQERATARTQLQLRHAGFKSPPEPIEFGTAIGIARQTSLFDLRSLTVALLSGNRSMNTKLALTAMVAALMLAACSKQEATSPTPAAESTPPASASTSESSTGPAGTSESSSSGPAAGAPATSAAPPAGAPPAGSPPANPPQQ